MLLRKEHTEPREYVRFKALEGSYVLLKSYPYQRLGFLVDVSSGGLSFEYIPDEGNLDRTEEIDIISDDKHIRVEKLSCKKIFEIELDDEMYTPIKLHRVGLQFEEIESSQLDALVGLVALAEA